MPPADKTPDFDSMSPEELMLWMESLAKRQGVQEGLTTAADMEVAEVDPEDVQIDEPGYVPYGMDPDKWRAQQEAEAAEKAARKAAAPPSAQPAPQPAPQPEPAAPSVPAAPAASGTPDFDSMSPEELMLWMESLAKRQGVQEGLTTTADMEVAEVDPDDVQIDEPGYVPYGMDPDKWRAQQEAEAAEKAARRAAARPSAQPAPPPTPQPAPQPAPQPEPELELPSFELDEELAMTELPSAEAREEVPADDAMAWLESLAADSSDTAVPQMDLSALGQEIEPLIPEAAGPSEGDPLAWLESLTQSEESELSGLALDFDEEEEEAAIAASSRPPAPSSEVVDPIESGINTVEWLESLARRQGVSDEELVTPADMDIPIPQDISEGGPGYTDFSFEESTLEPEGVTASVDELDTFDPDQLDDPEAWLESLATAQGFEPEFSKEADTDTAETEEDVISALNQGTDISPEKMQAWMNAQFDKAEQFADADEEIDDLDAPAVKAEMPDWLLEQMGAPPPLEESEPGDESAFSALVDEIVEAPIEDVPDWLEASAAEEETEPAALQGAAEETTLEEMPDWLRTSEDEDVEAAPETVGELPDWLQEEGQADASVESIFLTEEETITDEAEPAVVAPSAESQPGLGAESDIDTDDPWVIAFELERDESMQDIENVPDWYKARLEGRATSEAESTPGAPAQIDSQLQAASFEPETELAAGEVEELPDWLADATAVQEVEIAYEEGEAEPGEEMPDWLKDQVVFDQETSIVTDTDDLPDWLKEAEPGEEMPDWLKDTLRTEEQEAVQVKPPAPAAPAAPPVSPAPVPVAHAQIDAAATLETARSKVSSGDIAGSLIDFEAVIRANTYLEDVAAEVSKLANHPVHKENPAVYRVLGDSLMRQGKLQSALDTYRKALNLL